MIRKPRSSKKKQKLLRRKHNSPPYLPGVDEDLKTEKELRRLLGEPPEISREERLYKKKMWDYYLTYHTLPQGANPDSPEPIWRGWKWDWGFGRFIIFFLGLAFSVLIGSIIYYLIHYFIFGW